MMTVGSRTTEEIKKPRFQWKRWHVITLIVTAGLLLRLWAAWQLPVDADEPVYMHAGAGYAEFIKAGDWNGLIDYNYNREHPALVKVIYALPFLILEPQVGESVEYDFNRLVNVLFGTLAVLVLALADPIAGAFLAFDTMVIKYTSEVYLEAIPLFFTLVCVLALERALIPNQKSRWFWISAAALGAAGAGKNIYLLIGFVVVFMLITQRKYDWRQVILYFLAAIGVFFILNPSMWHDPFGTLLSTVNFHSNYTQSLDVKLANYPWYQPFSWIAASVPWHEQVFFFPSSDEIVFFLSVFGLYAAWKRRKWVLVWMVVGMGVLLVWPTKWPQYTLTLIPALCLSASEIIKLVFHRVKEFNDYWNWTSDNVMRVPKLFWWAVGIIALALLGGKVVYEVQVAFARQGWVLVTSETSPLGSNTVNDLEALDDGRMAIATSNGVSFWMPNQDAPWGESSVWYSVENSGLIGNQVADLLEASDGSWWFATDQGISHLTGKTWKSYDANDLDLPASSVLSLAEDSLGRIWAASVNGVSLFDGKTWQAAKQTETDGKGLTAFSVAVQRLPKGDVIWFGTMDGAARLDLGSGEWQVDAFGSETSHWGGVVDVMVDAHQRVWASSLGGGLARWDGEEWMVFRTSTSKIPYNTVNLIAELETDRYWVGMAYPVGNGGALAQFDGLTWTEFTHLNSGYDNYEVLGLARDIRGWIWIGTRTNGLLIYQPKK